MLWRDTFEIEMSYYSYKCILFVGGICDKYMMFSIEGINEIIIQKLKYQN